jgi:K+-sensing histidine kinase KdpD
MNRILLLLDHNRNRELLHAWLSQRYEVVEVVPPIKLADDFDLVIIDGVALDIMWQELFDYKNNEAPVFTPVLFITNHQSIKMVTRHLWHSVDEIIWSPIEKVELMARVEVLMRTRRLSVSLEQANQIKLNFLAMISHELRTPLTSIKGFASSMLATDIEWSDAQQHDFIQVINDEADKMQELIDQLLDLARLQSGTFAIHPVPINLCDIIAYSHTHFDTLTTMHKFNLEVPTDLPMVMADTHRIAQVLVNLIGNASKYSPLQSAITLQASQTSDCVQISVIDAGLGVPQDQRKSIFEAFRQVNNSVDGKGAGLGLAICKGIIEAHGSSIWIEDHEGPGLTINFTLPLAPVATPV